MAGHASSIKFIEICGETLLRLVLFDVSVQKEARSAQKHLVIDKIHKRITNHANEQSGLGPSPWTRESRGPQRTETKSSQLCARQQTRF